jgi:hypothetical protein
VLEFICGVPVRSTFLSPVLVDSLPLPFLPLPNSTSTFAFFFVCAAAEAALASESFFNERSCTARSCSCCSCSLVIAVRRCSCRHRPRSPAGKRLAQPLRCVGTPAAIAPHRFGATANVNAVSPNVSDALAVLAGADTGRARGRRFLDIGRDPCAICGIAHIELLIGHRIAEIEICAKAPPPRPILWRA